MTHLSEVLDMDLLNHHLREGNVSRSFHPDLPFSILGYTNACQYARAWDAVTMTCRGLIVDDDNHVVARSMGKFFNYTEVPLPKYAHSIPPVVTEKMDGSLAILFPRGDGTFDVATRGSFRSDQALWATEWLHQMMPDFSQPDGVTTLAEIIYPQNRIVVNYGDREELVLLGAIDNATGADIPLWEIDWWPGARAPHHVDVDSIDEAYRFATAYEKDEDEGVVAVWYRPNSPSLRVKFKNPRYVQLHRIITGMNSRRIWEVLSQGGDFQDVLEHVPDEFYGWVKGIVHNLNAQHRDIKMAALREFEQIVLEVGTESRKKFAERAKKSPNPSLIFSLLDGRSIDGAVWAMVKPSGSHTFSAQEEEV